MNSVTRKWLIGCGAFVVVAAVILVLVGAYVASRATEFVRDVESASDRYVETNREFPFTPPASGEFPPERFRQYLAVRAAVESAIRPIRESSGILGGLTALSNVPEEVSRAHVEALRQEKMSVDEYRWFSRQLYTTLAGETGRTDPDERLLQLKEDFQEALRSRGNVRFGGDSPNRNMFDAGFLDFTWLRVPDSTRKAVLDNITEIEDTLNAAMADGVLFNFGFGSRDR